MMKEKGEREAAKVDISRYGNTDAPKKASFAARVAGIIAPCSVGLVSE